MTKEQERALIQKQTEEFISNGGTIKQIPTFNKNDILKRLKKSFTSDYNKRV